MIILIKMMFIALNILILSLSLGANCDLTPTDIAENVRTLNDGYAMPAIAFGTLTKIDDIDEVEDAIMWAIETGYRHFNTAVFVDDDNQVGEAINNATSIGLVTREEIFITTTLNSDVKTTEEVIPAIEEDLKRLNLDYVDLYLLEFSSKFESYDFVAIWNGMEEAKKQGLAKSIGVSNFNSAQINKLLLNSDVRPAVNQIEVSPTYTELDLVAYCQGQNIEVMAYAPFGLLVSRPFKHSSDPSPSLYDVKLVSLAAKYEKTPGQIVLRYLNDRGIVPIPESLNKKHISENIGIFDFELTPKEIYSINELNTDEKVYPLDDSNQDDFNSHTED